MLWRFSPNSPVFSLDKRENNLLLPNCYSNIRYFFITHVQSIQLSYFGVSNGRMGAYESVCLPSMWLGFIIMNQFL